MNRAANVELLAFIDDVAVVEKSFNLSGVKNILEESFRSVWVATDSRAITSNSKVRVCENGA